MFGLGVSEIVIIVAVVAVLSFLYWRNKKNKTINY